MKCLNSLIEQAVKKVPIEGGLANRFPPTHKNYRTAVKFPCGQKTFYITFPHMGEKIELIKFRQIMC